MQSDQFNSYTMLYIKVKGFVIPANASTVQVRL